VFSCLPVEPARVSAERIRTHRRRQGGFRAGLRRARFWLLEHVMLPLAILPLRLLIATWRIRGPEADAVDAVTRSPRVVFITFHGMLLHLLAFSNMQRTFGRPFVVLLSPSLDGRLLAATLRRFGIQHVRGTSGSRGVAGAAEFIRRVQHGAIGIIAADGPNGPCAVAKPGTIRLARAAEARIGLAVTWASRGAHLGSWDRAHLPLPFARVEASLRLLPPHTDDMPQAVVATQNALVSAARAIGSPVLPLELRAVSNGQRARPPG
jgi:lysophospholipid acyltransferase (LPLAT)-like uncharacterized protein